MVTTLRRTLNLCTRSLAKVAAVLVGIGFITVSRIATKTITLIYSRPVAAGPVTLAHAGAAVVTTIVAAPAMLCKDLKG